MAQEINQQSQQKPMPSYLVILRYTIGGFLTAIIISALINSIPEPFDQPSRLPPLPANAEIIRTIEELHQHFGEAGLIVQATDKKYYFYDWNGSSYEWSLSEKSEWDKAVSMPECSPDVVKAIEATSEDITSCGQLDLVGEGCDIPKAYAISSDGYVWEIHVPRPCFLIQAINTIYSIVLITPVGLVLGIIMVVLRKPKLTKDLQPQPANGLDADEVQIIKLIAEGLSNLEIAERLNKSAVHTSLMTTDLLDKFGVESKDELVRVAKEKGFIPSD